MIIQIVYVVGVLAFKAENDTIVARHFNRIEAGQLSTQRVKVRAGLIHRLWTFSSLQAGQNQLDLFDVLFVAAWNGRPWCYTVPGPCAGN